MKPLLPGIVYYLLQGHISVFLLSLVGLTTAIAEVGALGRLGQIIGILALLNGFFVQPYFARIMNRKVFTIRAAQVGVALGLSFALITASSITLPNAWLFILGPNYGSLAKELVLALVSAQLSVMGAILYTIVIATRRTRGQWLQIVLGATAQLAYLALFDVKGTHDALILSMLPAATYAILQCALLVYTLMTWNESGARR